MANSSSFPPQLACTLVSNLPSLLSGLESVLPLALGRDCWPGVWAAAPYAGDFTEGFVLNWCHYKRTLATSSCSSIPLADPDHVVLPDIKPSGCSNVINSLS